MVLRGRPYWRWVVPCLVLALGFGTSLVGPVASSAAVASPATTSSTPGYWLVGADGGVFGFDEPFYGSGYSSSPNTCAFSPQPPSSLNGADGCTAVAPVPDGSGYWLVNAYRIATGFGKASPKGGCTSLNGASGRWVGVAASTTGGGYWLAAGNGGVMGCGDMPGPFGGTASLSLDAPIVSMAPTPDRLGYWLVAADGGVFAFGDAGYFGSMGGHPLDAPIVGIASTSDGQGYWLVASDGGIFAFGDAVFAGSMGGQPLNAPMTGMSANPSGPGYWTVAADGGVFSFGGAPYVGGMAGAPLAAPVIGIASTPSFPGAPPCDTGPPGSNAPGFEPGAIFMGCATNADSLESVTWTSWTATAATGTGTHFINYCVPDCANSTSFVRFPVAIQLSDPGQLEGMEVFKTISMTPTTKVGTAETVTATGLYGLWGWVPS